MKECCSTCASCKKLVKFDYSGRGCKHTDMEGYACLAFETEGTVIWMVGNDKDHGMCECYIAVGEEEE